MKNSEILRTVMTLRAHVGAMLRLNPDTSEEQLVHNFLAACDLAPTEHDAILHEYRRRRALSGSGTKL
jgi:hypothetical protein